MALKKELIQFNIVNQTDCSFNLPLFQQNVYSVNATTKYTWDITTADLSCGTGTIVVNGNTLPLVFAANLAGLLAALNALGFGFFCSQTFEGSTYFYTVDDTNVYGDVDLCPVVGTTTTTTTTTTVAPPPTTTTTTTTTTAAPTTSTTTSTTTVAPETTTTTTTTTIEPPSTTTTTTTTTEPPSTTTTTTTTTEPPSTTTTTTTTTEPPSTTTTTTTTTIAILCDEYFNNTGGDFNGINYTDCNGGVFTNQTVEPNQSICVQQGTLNGGDSGFLINLGSCNIAPETTTTTTTTTVPETTTTTTTSTTTVAFTNGYSSASSTDACTAGIPMTGISYIGGTGLCDSTSIQCDQFAGEIAGATVWVSIGGQVREATIDDPNVSGIATFVAACTACGAYL